MLVTESEEKEDLGTDEAQIILFVSGSVIPRDRLLLISALYCFVDGDRLLDILVEPWLIGAGWSRPPA